MWQKVGGLFDRRRGAEFDEVDVRQAVERWLNEQGVHTARCTEARGERVVVYGGSPFYQQEVRLLEYDLASYLKEEFGFELAELVTRR